MCPDFPKRRSLNNKPEPDYNYLYMIYSSFEKKSIDYELEGIEDLEDKKYLERMLKVLRREEFIKYYDKMPYIRQEYEVSKWEDGFEAWLIDCKRRNRLRHSRNKQFGYSPEIVELVNEFIQKNKNDRDF